ncbi:ribosomal RNA small subunit methyltransferase NEP1-like isoform X1 [Coffea eugenioides]|uniref:ribosomal RNA small subunit methyltransferase NEP1-like isoform X1 n=2 Tax=Coffea eugenioides TaxID=49369 RepID=UPI000F60F273|nr:ribosomal RNA small subunit methyltransferase NEP1-like isoform X1 [Coffea eugenioides]
MPLLLLMMFSSLMVENCVEEWQALNQSQMMLKACSADGTLKRKKEPEAADDERGKRNEIPELALTPHEIGRRKVNFIFDNAAIKKTLVKKKWKVPCSLDDAEIILRQNKDVNQYRCDILHEALRAILDSPLNRYGLVGAIYVKIENGVLFEVKPQVRIPRTLQRFCGLMMNLLEKSCIRTEGTKEVLLRVIQEPVTRYLPTNSHIIGLSHTSPKVVNIEDYLSAVDDDINLTFVVGTSVQGEINQQYVDDCLTVTNYPLSAKGSIGMICHVLEHKWNIF